MILRVKRVVVAASVAFFLPLALGTESPSVFGEPGTPAKATPLTLVSRSDLPVDLLRGVNEERSLEILEPESAHLESPSINRSNHRLPKDEQRIGSAKWLAPASPQLVLALIQYSSWNTIFSGEPIFALYDDGTVIYFKASPTDGKYLVAKLTDELTSKLLTKVSVQQVESLDGFYDSSGGANDVSEYVIVRRTLEKTYKHVIVHGPLGAVRTRSGTTYQRLPRALIEVVDYLSSFDAPDAAVWIPDYVEVIIWPYDYFTKEAAIWPPAWPDLSDSKTVKKGHKYSLFIEKSRYPELKSLLSSLRNGQGVRISGEAWAITARFPFPQEEIWSEIERSK